MTRKNAAGTSKGRGPSAKAKLAKGFSADERAADRTLATQLHALIKAHAPRSPRTWCGMPAYARDGQVVCFFQGAAKFKTRYATWGEPGS